MDRMITSCREIVYIFTYFFFASLGTMYGVTDHLQPTLRIYLSLERMDHCVHHVAIFFFCTIFC